VVLALLMLFSALVELRQSKKELFELMEVNAHAILDAVAEGSAFSIYSNQLLQNELFERLYDNALLLKELDSENNLSPKKLREIVKTNDLGQILFFNAGLSLEKFTVNDEYLNKPAIPSGEDIIQSLSSGDNAKDWILIHGNESNKLFSIIIKRKKAGALAVSVEGKVLLEFRKKTGIGVLISEIAANPNIVFLAVQDTFGIIAAKNVTELSPINEDTLVHKVLTTGQMASRVSRHNGSEVFEVIHPFTISGRVSGVYRMGLSLNSLETINRRIIRRLIIISVILLFLGTILMVLINYRQQYEFVNKAFDRIQSYYRNVVNNIKDGILTVNEKGEIITANPAAEKILGIPFSELKEMSLEKLNLIPGNSEKKENYKIEYDYSGRKKYLTLSIASLPTTEANKSEKIILLQDNTEKVSLENQIRQKEKLSAMGKLASGVAHEVRNPLNAISTIVQQFDLDFEPKENGEEYHSLAKLVISEVKRINKIITQFVNLARPPKLVFQPCDAKSFFEEIKHIGFGLIGNKNIKFTMTNNISGTVLWDCEQIKQSLINLLKNAVEAIEDEGNITLDIGKKEEKIVITIADDGTGISQSLQEKIFDLYYTTKNDGTGLGLSIVHRIISGHNGIITVSSIPDIGTRFIIEIPKEVKTDG
jgi:PAS domain S-box-containing protein